MVQVRAQGDSAIYMKQLSTPSAKIDQGYDVYRVVVKKTANEYADKPTHGIGHVVKAKVHGHLILL